MGLLKRLFSMGSKKNKKEKPPIVHNVPVPELPWSGLLSESSANLATNEEEHEAAVGRLLRSSSARFTESSELNYATLPPLPHPINHVIQTPASSSVSLASTTISQRGTFNVTIHKRRRHTSTEIPPVPTDHSTPSKKSSSNGKRSSLLAEDSRVLRLRSDPSISSLLELYDEHGKVAADAFSNDSPVRERPKEGRAQVRRNGSTLRQLLGASPSLYSHDGNESGSGEGDISWAERFLAETDAASSISSIGIQTPVTPHYYTQPLKPETSFITDGDVSISTFDNPAISSMEVEVSTTADISQDMQDSEFSKTYHTSPYTTANPSTPQRASQVFEFLTRKQSTTATNLDRTLPELPSCFSTPSDENGSNLNFHFNDPPPFTFAPKRMSTSSASFYDKTPKPGRPRPHSSILERSPSILDTRESRYLRSAFSDDSHETHYASGIHVHQDPQETTQKPVAQETKKNDIKVIMNGPTKVIVTAPTPSAHGDLPSRLPRGPRAPPKKPSSGSVKRRRSALVEVSNSSPTSPSDPFAVAPPRRRLQTHRRSSQTSVNSRSSYDEYPSRLRQPEIVSPTVGQYKENQLGLSVKAELPSTPMRSNTRSRSLLRTVVQQAMFRPPLSAAVMPSPASSSEMSPVGRQIMMDVRQQRMHAREAERDRASRRTRSDRPQRI